VTIPTDQREPDLSPMTPTELTHKKAATFVAARAALARRRPEGNLSSSDNR